MATIRTDDGVDLYYESTGDGPPILFLHEFAGDHRSWATQVAHFSARYRCIVYAARGYPPSSVPDDETAYSQQRAVLDALAVLDATHTPAAHIIGLSMGGFCALHLADQHPDRVLSLVAASVGYGASPSRAKAFREDTARTAETFLSAGSTAAADLIAHGPGRITFLTHDPTGWTTFRDGLATHSATGSALTMLGVQMTRPSLYDLTDRWSTLPTPTLLIAGDEDDGCLEPSLMLKRSIPAAGFVVFPQTGHTLNLERLNKFNQTVDEFLTAVTQRRWLQRDARSIGARVVR